MKLTLGFSPCPNDTFIFDALVNNKIDSGILQFEPVLEDVQQLNKWAIEGRLDISKISYGVLPYILKNYVILSSGGALGKGVGPLLITNNEKGINPENINDALIAIPGENTTAHLLFSLAFPDAKNKIFLVFNQIEDWLNEDPFNRAGVIIHENRFTYQEKGLRKLVDLGEFWEKTTGYPIPLGGIAIKKTLPTEIIYEVGRLIKKSLEFSFANDYATLTDYVKQHAQEMSETVMRQHINLYVNDFSLDLGEAGRKAVLKLLEVFNKTNPDVQINKEAIFA